MKQLITVIAIVSTLLYGNTVNAGGKTGSTKSKKNTDTYYYGYTTTNSSVRYQKGYVKKDGKYVQPHMKTTTNQTNTDNLSTTPHTNQYTGQAGYKAQDYSPAAYNYGSGKTIQTGPKGGQYYTNDNGKKVYVPKRK